jgi:amidase
LTDIAYLPAHKLAGKLRSREIGCLELLEHHLARVERFNPALNAIIWNDLEAARERRTRRIRCSPAARPGGPARPAHDHQELRSRRRADDLGHSELSGHIAKTDAVTTARLRGRVPSSSARPMCR